MAEISWNETVKRDRGFARAREFYLANEGSHEIIDVRSQLCIASNDKAGMMPSCWDAVKAQYPEADVE
tara:strand:- start:801 stop:1004 length:204 start_codon:yes stop_codon:yes gene_type:complete